MRNSVRETIFQKINSLNITGGLSKEEKAVLNVVFGLEPGTRITCREVASSAAFLGCHPEWELDVGYPPEPSTMRKIFQIVHDLRKKGVAILGDRGGFYFPVSESEIEDFLKANRKKAIATLEGYNAAVDGIAEGFEFARQYRFDFGDDSL